MQASQKKAPVYFSVSWEASEEAFKAKEAQVLEILGSFGDGGEFLKVYDDQRRRIPGRVLCRLFFYAKDLEHVEGCARSLVLTIPETDFRLRANCDPVLVKIPSRMEGWRDGRLGISYTPSKAGDWVGFEVLGIADRHGLGFDGVFLVEDGRGPGLPGPWKPGKIISRVLSFVSPDPLHLLGVIPKMLEGKPEKVDLEFRFNTELRPHLN